MSNSTALVRSLPYCWRLSRYPASGRDDRGAFIPATWTSIADIGIAFDGQVLTSSEYERVEDAYVDSFRFFAEEAGAPDLELRAVDQAPPDATLVEGSLVSAHEAEPLLRSMLREEVICKLEARDDSFYLHVGYDLYMYLGSTRRCEAAIGRSEEIGLVVDSRWPSPQLPEQ